ncbi:hypothetical protein BGX38DRAFT_1220334 [Terfezia claveryi]|nr:hypothetical protein BGX38DRAFT_1220334 [Terfezia claveryi]
MTRRTDPHQRKLRQAFIKRYFTRDPADWKLSSFRDYLLGNSEGFAFLSDNTNIHGFWLEMLRELKKNGTGTQQAKASQVLDEGIGIMTGRKTARSNARPRREHATTSKFIFHGPSQVGSIITGSRSTATGNTTHAPEAGPSNSEPAEQNFPVPQSDEHIQTPDRDPEHEQEPLNPHNLRQGKTWPGGKPVDCISLPTNDWVTRGIGTANFQKLLYYGIVDLDAITEGEYPVEHAELHACIFKLPQCNPDLEYTLSRFQSCIERIDWIEITESNPRPLHTPPTPQNFVCTYANRSISHWLSHMTRIPTNRLSLKEGNYDILWSTIIDDLWSDGLMPHLLLLRKELNTHVLGKTDRFDGLFRYTDGARSFDVGVTEASIPPVNLNRDPKGENDVLKIQRAMVSMLWDLKQRVRHDWEVVRKLQVFGMVSAGLSLRIHRMQFANADYCVVKRSDPYVVSLGIDGAEDMFALLRILTRVKAAMEETIELVLRASRQNSF